MKSILEYKYRPYTTNNILRTFAASGALGLLAICGGFTLLGPPATDGPGPRRVSLGTLALKEAGGREATSAVGSWGAAVAMVVCGALAPLVGYLAVRKCFRRKQRLALRPDGVLLPLAEKPVEYRCIHFLWTDGPRGARHLQVDYDKSKRCILYESGLPAPGAFDEIHALLKRRTDAARNTTEA